MGIKLFITSIALISACGAIAIYKDPSISTTIIVIFLCLACVMLITQVFWLPAILAFVVMIIALYSLFTQSTHNMIESQDRVMMGTSILLEHCPAPVSPLREKLILNCSLQQNKEKINLIASSWKAVHLGPFTSLLDAALKTPPDKLTDCDKAVLNLHKTCPIIADMLSKD
ncbi:hypothetical protein [Chromohalobacter canadensis]|uniref:hypothetical protein n=1 Tax=Chromohalobacter canadensis TaxID=141389 RepID=UPI000BE3B726|nr:hypothetical protein [Chromohalobacter canadensis]